MEKPETTAAYLTTWRKRESSDGDATAGQQLRFELELEFVQCLANPRYLAWLSQQKYLDDPTFLNYLTYLAYWRRPEYACFLE